MGLAVSEQSLASLWDLQAQTSRKRQGVYRDLELRSGKPAVVRIHMATETREVDEVSLETKEKKKKSFKKAGIGNGVGGCGSRQARSLRIQSAELVTGGLGKRPDIGHSGQTDGWEMRSRNRPCRPCVLEVCGFQARRATCKRARTGIYPRTGIWDCGGLQLFQSYCILNFLTCSKAESKRPQGQADFSVEGFQFSSVQSLSPVQLFATPWTAAL